MGNKCNDMQGEAARKKKNILWLERCSWYMIGKDKQKNPQNSVCPHVTTPISFIKKEVHLHRYAHTKHIRGTVENWQ